MADPFLLLVLGQGQQEHVPGRGHVVVYCRDQHTGSQININVSLIFTLFTDAKIVILIYRFGCQNQLKHRYGITTQSGNFTFAGSHNILLFVQVVFVTLLMAAAALQGRRRLEDVP